MSTLMSPADLAGELGMKTQTIYDYLCRCPDRLPPHIRLHETGRPVFRRATFERWLDEKEAVNNPEPDPTPGASRPRRMKTGARKSAGRKAANQ